MKKSEMTYENPTRLYTLNEINQIMKDRGMEVFGAYSDYHGTAASKNGFYLRPYEPVGLFQS